MTNDLHKNMKNLKTEEPKFEKWNELPFELKLEIIKRLDFKTRCNLRSTCRLEKSLVDSQKFHIDNVELYSNFMGQRILYEHKSQEKYKEYNSDVEMLLSFYYIMEHAIIEEVLIFNKEDKLLDMSDRLRPLPWNVKHLELRSGKQGNLNFCLRRLNEKVERIEINTDWSEKFSFDSILTIPQIIKVPFLEIRNMKQPDLHNVYKLAQIWIKNDASIGQRFYLDLVVHGKYKDFNEFIGEFSTRIVQMETADGRRLAAGNRPKNAQNLRIQTDNPSKHILIQIGDLVDTEIYGDWLHMTVIPADMKETEYDWKWSGNFEDNSGQGDFDFREFLDAINNVNLDHLDHLFLNL